MDNTAKWIFTLVATVLLLYACVLCRDTNRELVIARERLQTLYETRDMLDRENEDLSRRIGADAAGLTP